MYLPLMISVLILSPAHFLPAKDESRINGGREANDNEFPWMVFIRLTDELNCSGFLISSSYLLTAAHCMIGRNVEDMTGVVGLVDREQATNMLEFEKYIMHPAYNITDFSSDLALLKFKTPLQLTESIRPICIGRRRSFIAAGNPVLQMGWGKYRNDSAEVSRKLKVTDVGNIITENECSLLGKINISLEGRLCVMNREVEGVCEGDSGGPLVYNNGNMDVVIGLDSIGFYSNCTVSNRYPEIFTNVAYFFQWIISNVEESVCAIL